MAKKKSKSQKQRKNLKKKRKVIAQVKGHVTTKDEVLYNVALTNPDIFKNTNKQINMENDKPQKSTKEKNKKSVISVEKNKSLKNNNKAKKQNKLIKENKLKNKKINNSNDIVSLVFSCVLLLSFVILFIGILTVDVYSGKFILWGAILLGFLVLIALSYNKYTSGKIFTIMLVLGMGFCTYRLQYTYDFIHHLNVAKYEYKKYYLVGFDTPQNVSAYSVNGKKVGLLNYNNKNVQRKVDTKLDRVNYLLYDNEDQLFNALYDSDVRALLVTENQLKYLETDSKFHSDKNIKVLSEFKINAPK